MQNLKAFGDVCALQSIMSVILIKPDMCYPVFSFVYVFQSLEQGSMRVKDWLLVQGVVCVGYMVLALSFCGVKRWHSLAHTGTCYYSLSGHSLEGFFHQSSSFAFVPKENKV